MFDEHSSGRRAIPPPAPTTNPAPPYSLGADPERTSEYDRDTLTEFLAAGEALDAEEALLSREAV